jgi:GNAT superfamily N-acetyltransferase
VQHPRAFELSDEHIRAGLVVVFEHWGAPAGFVVVIPRNDGVADLEGPFVEPDLWRSGIGRKLVEEAAHFATALEANALVANASQRAAPFYAKCGFATAEVVKTPHGPVSLMSRSLVF